jgi:tRNA G18 (ribose-2'-O)-methylase SpoU
MIEHPTQDARNVMDEFKNMPHEEIVTILDTRGVELEIAIENTLRDYNMGTIVRNANAFGVRTVHVIGRRQWNKRGAMATDKYLTIAYHQTATDFVQAMRQTPKQIVAIDITKTSQPLSTTELPKNCVFVFGQEGPGLSDTMLAQADAVAHIEQLGSTRSVNVGVAAGIAMYEWLRRNKL